MRKGLVTYGLAAGLLVGLGLTDAQAAATRPISPEALGLGAAATPIAMCGFRCRYGVATFLARRASALPVGSTTAGHRAVGVGRCLGPGAGSTVAGLTVLGPTMGGLTGAGPMVLVPMAPSET